MAKKVTPVEWRTLPEFRDYEMNLLGDIRHKKSQDVVRPQYAGDATFTVVLQMDNEKSDTRTVTSLFNSVFPERAVRM